MKQSILNKLYEIEEKYQIKILFAIESGSRAWGFPSVDSDYDVRFIYTKSLNEYLKVNHTDDFLDFAINDDLDFKGWDLKKFLKLMYASNATPFEWIQSPIFYISKDDFIIEINQTLSNYFCQQTLTHHYLGLSKKKTEQLDDENIKLKDLFYVLRSLLAAKYCLVKNECPPMEFSKLIFLVDNETILNEINTLQQLKSKTDERFLSTISNELKVYIADLYKEISVSIKIKSKGNFDNDLLNTTYLKLLQHANDRFFKEK